MMHAQGTSIFLSPGMAEGKEVCGDLQLQCGVERFMSDVND